jgi:hypothetical protein
MAVWCHLHGLVRKQPGGKGGSHTSPVSFTEDLNFVYSKYEARAYTLPLFRST